LRKIDKANETKDLWAAVSRLTGAHGLSGDHTGHSAEVLNSHFAATSTDHQYVQQPLKMTVCSDYQFFNEKLIFGLLDHLRPTADGLD